jgi:hypothetical protein
VAGTNVSEETSASVLKVGLSGTLEPFFHITMYLIPELINFHLISGFIFIILGILIASSLYLTSTGISSVCKMDGRG